LDHNQRDEARAEATARPPHDWGSRPDVCGGLVLSETQLLVALLALGVILVFARGAGELARRIGQPEVLGEFFAGSVSSVSSKPSVARVATLKVLSPAMLRVLHSQCHCLSYEHVV
jgi:hypothetical protein